MWWLRSYWSVSVRLFILWIRWLLQFILYSILREVKMLYSWFLNRKVLKWKMRKHRRKVWVLAVHSLVWLIWKIGDLSKVWKKNPFVLKVLFRSFSIVGRLGVGRASPSFDAFVDFVDSLHMWLQWALLYLWPFFFHSLGPSFVHRLHPLDALSVYSLLVLKWKSQQLKRRGTIFK